MGGGGANHFFTMLKKDTCLQEKSDESDISGMKLFSNKDTNNKLLSLLS